MRVHRAVARRHAFSAFTHRLRAKPDTSVAEAADARASAPSGITRSRHIAHRSRRLASAQHTTGGSLPAGKYYLDSDLTLSTAVAVSGGSESKAYLSIMNGDVELCLNGHILRGSGGAQIFAVGGTGTLTLCDCDDSTEHKYYLGTHGEYIFNDSGLRFRAGG